jgi:hypothetical protein
MGKLTDEHRGSSAGQGGEPIRQGDDRLVVYADDGYLRRLLPLAAAIGPFTLVLLMETLPSEAALEGLHWMARGLWQLWELVYYLVVFVIFWVVGGGVWQALRHRAVLRLDPGGITDNRDGSPIACWDQVGAVERGTTTLESPTLRKPRRRYGRMHNDPFPALVLRLEHPAPAGFAAAASPQREVVSLDIEDRSSPPHEIVEFARRLHARYHERPMSVPPDPLPSRGRGLLLLALSVVLALVSFVSGVTLVEPELSADAPSGRGPASAEASYHVGGFTVSSVQITEDDFGDFTATATVTSPEAERSGRSAIELTLLRGGQQVGRVNGVVSPLRPGTSERVELWGSDDYVEGVDELVFRIG